MLLSYLLQVTLCLACFYAFYHIVLHKETLFHTNRIYLITTLFFSLLLPWIRIYVEAHQELSSITIPTYVYIGSYLNAMGEAISVKPKERGIPWLYICKTIYLTGVLVMGLHFVNELIEIMNIKRKGIKKLILGHICVTSSSVKSPFSFFNTIYLPADHQFNDQELEEIIAHEEKHVRSRHSWDILFMELVCIGLWPSPMVYLYRKKLKEVHEFLADAEVLKNTPWESYANFLVSQKSGGLQNRLSNQMFYSQLKNRLEMMTQKPSSFFARFKYLGIIPILSLALILFSFREKLIPEKQSNQSDRKIILTVTADHHYLINLKEVPHEQLEMALTEEMKNNAERTVYLDISGSLTVGDLSEIMDILQKLNIRVVLETPDPEKDQMQILDSDSVPEVVITALRPTKSDEEATKVDEKSGKEIFTYVEEMPRFPGEGSPRFPGANEALFSYINKNIKYPNEDRAKGIEGMVLVQFIVEADGSISNAKVVRGVSPGLNAEALRVVNEMNNLPEKWTPGKHEGRNVAVQFTLPIKFLLNEQKTEPASPIQNPKTDSDQEVFTFVEEMPSFPGGPDAMYKYIYETISYPKEDREQGKEGMVIINFIVEADGSITNAKVLRGVSPGLNAEGLRVINGMNDLPEKWIPGKHEGKNVAVQFTLPLKFVLQEQKTEKVISPPENADKSELPRISLSPNPVSDNITIEFSKDVISAVVIGNSGVIWRKTFKEGEDRNQQVDVSKWIPGTYTVQADTRLHTHSLSFVVTHD